MWIYNLGLVLYVWAIALASPWHRKAKLWIDGRKGLFRRMKESIDPSARIIWIHAASLGEFEQGRPLIEKIRKEHPEYKILLTFFSPSGYEIRKNYKGVDYIFYLPIDTPGTARIARSSSSRSGAVNFFESFTAGSDTPRGNTTAAATTGPASGPRPTSSTPATKQNPSAQHSRSGRRSSSASDNNAETRFDMK